MTDFRDFSILAPVPLEHLRSGVEIASNTGFVAFGSRKWQFFRRIDELRTGKRVPALIYPSHEGVPAKESYIVSWVGWYVGSVESGIGRHPEGMTHRPPTAEHDSPDFAVFWHVCKLRELTDEHRLPISKIQTVKGGWRKDAPPLGPERVAIPHTLNWPP